MAEMPVWMMLSFIAGPVVAFVLGISRLWTWRKPSRLLICAALAQAGHLLGYRSFTEISELIKSAFDVSDMQSVNLTGVMYNFTAMVPLVLLLWAVFCDRDAPRGPGTSPAS